MATIDRLRKRRCYPVKCGDETFYVRAMTFGEMEIVTGLDSDAAVGFGVGTCLVEQDGSSVFTRAADETPEAFGKRVAKELADLPQDTLADLTEAIGKSGKVQKPETISKN